MVSPPQSKRLEDRVSNDLDLLALVAERESAKESCSEKLSPLKGRDHGQNLSPGPQITKGKRTSARKPKTLPGEPSTPCMEIVNFTLYYAQ